MAVRATVGVSAISRLYSLVEAGIGSAVDATEIMAANPNACVPMGAHGASGVAASWHRRTFGQHRRFARSTRRLFGRTARGHRGIENRRKKAGWNADYLETVIEGEA